MNKLSVTTGKHQRWHIEASYDSSDIVISCARFEWVDHPYHGRKRCRTALHTKIRVQSDYLTTVAWPCKSVKSAVLGKVLAERLRILPNNRVWVRDQLAIWKDDRDNLRYRLMKAKRDLRIKTEGELLQKLHGADAYAEKMYGSYRYIITLKYRKATEKELESPTLWCQQSETRCKGDMVEHSIRRTQIDY